MDVWIEKWEHQWIVGQLDGWMDGLPLDGWMGGCITIGWIGRWMNGLSVPMEGCIEDGKIDGCIDG